MLQPPATCHYCSNNLVGKSAQEIGQYALEYERTNRYVRSGMPQVLLSRGITREEYTSLGLGCLADSDSIEQPPLALVILRGDFDLNQFPGGMTVPIAQTTQRPIYMSLVFDLWAGMLTAWHTSYSGRLFSTISR